MASEVAAVDATLVMAFTLIGACMSTWFNALYSLNNVIMHYYRRETHNLNVWLNKSATSVSLATLRDRMRASHVGG